MGMKMWDVAAKDLLQLVRDRTALIMLIAVPLLLIGIFGTVLSGAFGGGARVTATLPVVDHDGGSSARALIAALRQVPSLTVQMEHDQRAEEKAVRNGDQVGLLIIPAGFSAALQSGSSTARVTYYNVPNDTGASAQLARDVVESVVQRMAFSAITARAVTAAQRQSTGRVDQAAVSRISAQASRELAANPPVGVQTVNATGRKTNNADNTVPGYALMFALFGLAGGAGSVLDEKEAGTFKRLLIAPISPFALLGGKLLAQFIQAMGQLTILFVLGALLFKINLGSSIPALILIIVGTSFAATGLGFILISFVKTQRQLRPVTTLIVLTFSAVGGSWWPISIEPQWMQSLSRITLNSWAMQGFNGLMIFDRSFMQVLPDIAALFIYGLVCFAIARRTFRFREA